MPGVPGRGGPPPKRASQRRRANKPEVPVDRAAGARKVTAPKPDPKWHPVARRWYNSLPRSGQAAFYEPSDWGSAYLIAEAISRELAPQPMVVGHGEDAHIEMVTLPPKGASLAAWLKAMTALMATEGDRRRARLELDRPGPAKEAEEADVSELAEYRRRLGAG